MMDLEWWKMNNKERKFLKIQNSKFNIQNS